MSHATKRMLHLRKWKHWGDCQCCHEFAGRIYNSYEGRYMCERCQDSWLEMMADVMEDMKPVKFARAEPTFREFGEIPF